MERLEEWHTLLRFRLFIKLLLPTLGYPATPTVMLPALGL